MSQKELEVISVLGPLGAGKTTTLNHLIEHVPLGDSYAVVVNDVGENNIDARRIWDHPANRSEKIIPLTAGCIGCSDVTQFKEALEQVHDAGVNVLFIEPTGIAPGTEIADVVQSSGFDLSVLTLANAQTIERDLKWQVLPSQLAVANIIGISHIPAGASEAEVMALALEQLPPLPDAVSVELIKPGMTNYFDILAKLRGMDKQLRLGRSIVRDVCHIACDHDHEHEHHEGHGVSAKSFRLKNSVSVTRIAELLRPLVASERTPLLRAKGIANGIRFDLVGNEWNERPEDSDSPNTMNVIFGGSMPAHFLTEVQALTESVERIEITGDKKAIVKSISDMPVADRQAIVADRITQYPGAISPLHGELIPDCEADEGYEIAFWGNRDDMPDNTKFDAMRAYIGFRLNGLHELQHHANTIANSKQKGAYWQRRYGATLGYNGYYLADYITPSQLEKIREHNPAKLLLDGLLQLDALTFDEGRAEEKPEFVAGVLRAALTAEHVTANDIAVLKAHILPLASASSTHYERWDKAFRQMRLDVL